jgi:hypothetical protein
VLEIEMKDRIKIKRERDNGPGKKNTLNITTGDRQEKMGHAHFR